MDQHRDLLVPNGRREAKLDWQAERAQLQDSLDELHKMMDRLHSMRTAYLDLLECAQTNIQDAHALERELNSFAIQLQLSPTPKRAIEWQAIQRRSSSTPKLERMR